MGRCSETGVNVFRRYGNVWCPWEVGSLKEGRAGSNPVTSDLSPHLRQFFVNLKEYIKIDKTIYIDTTKRCQ